MFSTYSTRENRGDNEITNNLLNHLEFLESPIENISTIVPDYDIRINDIGQDDLHNYYYFLKMQMEDLEKIKYILELDTKSQKEELNTNEMYINDIEREIKIADKEKHEMSQEKQKIEEELKKLREDSEVEMNLSKINTLHLSNANSNEVSNIYANYKSSDLGNIRNELSSYQSKSSSSSSQIGKGSKKEKQKKVKELKSNLYRLEKTLNDAKKFYQEKFLKNDLFVRENEALNDTLKYKVQIAEQIRGEIQEYANEKDSKITKDNSYYTKSTGSTDKDNKKNDKKSILGFVKNIFKK